MYITYNICNPHSLYIEIRLASKGSNIQFKSDSKYLFGGDQESQKYFNFHPGLTF